MYVLMPEDRIAIDSGLKSLAEGISTEAMIDWALNSGMLNHLTWPAERIDTLTRNAAEIFDVLGPERNHARYRTAVLRLGYARKEFNLDA